MAGSLRSTGITPLPSYCEPSRHPLVFGRFPGVAGYTAYLAPAISCRDEEGFSSCSACPCHRAVASTPPKVSSRVGQISAAPAFALGWRARLSGLVLSRPQRVLFRYGPMTRDLPQGDFVDRLQRFCFRLLCYPNYRALTLALVGLTPTEHASLRGTHQPRPASSGRALLLCHMASKKVDNNRQLKSRLAIALILGRSAAVSRLGPIVVAPMTTRI
ncbi:hypothetical protein ABIG06_001569 [Bradyrhizobium sp. USDA 326]